MKCKHLGMEAVCEFLGPFLNYSIIKVPVTSSSSTFLRNLVSTMAAFCCFFPQEAIPIIMLLTGRLKFFPCKNAEEVTVVSYIFECLVDAYKVVLRQLVGIGLLVDEAQSCGLALLEAVLLQNRQFRFFSGGVERILDAARHTLVVQKELGLNYSTDLSLVMLSLFEFLTQSELEHEQNTILQLVLFLLRWKYESDHSVGASAIESIEEILFIFPVLALVSSPSRSIKQTATDLLSLLDKIATSLLVAPKEKYVVGGKHLQITTPGYIVFRFLRNMWFEDQLTWTSSVREYCLRLLGKGKATSSTSLSKEIFSAEIPLILCAVASVFLSHPTRNYSIDLLATLSNIEPMIGVPMLLLTLFYNHVCSSAEKYDFHDLRSVIKAAAIRLMSMAWEINGRIFESLQAMLHPDGLVKYGAERDICMSIAASVEDICKRNPDRGVDIISSVAACIENHDPWVQSFGLQSLAHLCEADVIDFYTAVDVISKHIQNYCGNAIVAYGLSLLLRWGAMDAEAYPEASTNVLNILWNIGTYREVSKTSLWTRAREAAFVALSQYDVLHIRRSIPDFSTRNMEFFISQTHPDLLATFEDFEVKIISFEHITRRRYIKHKRISGSGSKIVKLLDVVPGVIFSSGSKHRINEFPGAALLCFPTHNDVKNQGSSKDVHAKYEDAAVEISASLHLSKNLFLALLSLQSWKTFMQRWYRSVLEANVHGTGSDKILKAANGILKTLTRLAEAAIPRAAENLTLALGAFCLVLPASAHLVKSMASKFLLKWLSQYEHEYRQWSAAISLGSISSCLHVTDHEQKFKNISALIEVASFSKSTLVKGACGVGLGFSCQDLLTRVDSGSNNQSGKETYNMQETELLRKIIRTLIEMIYQLGGSSDDILKKLKEYFSLETDDFSTEVKFLSEDIDHLGEDAFAVAGPLIGLGNSLGAIYRAGAYDAVLLLKDLAISWIPDINDTCFLSLGACLALPTIVSFCLRVEMIDDTELGRIMSGFTQLISKLSSVERSDTFHQSLLVASCAGAGSLLSIVSNAGLNSFEVEDVKRLLALFSRTYSSPYPPFVHLGGMLGGVNAMGAGAGTLFDQKVATQELSHVSGPLLLNHVLEAESTSLIQEIFLVAQIHDDPQSQQLAAWAISFLRHSVFSREHTNEESAVHSDPGASKAVSQGFSEDSLVMKLSMWLIQMNYSKPGSCVNIRTIALALRCLSRAPRLPSIDWGAVIRRCMQYGGEVAEMPSQDTKGTLRENCFSFLLSHASQSDSLLGILDGLYDLARFKTLELNLQSLVLMKTADLLKTFSSSRLVKLFIDMAEFLHGLVSSDRYDHDGRTSLRVSCWKGLGICLDEPALETRDYARNLENCMEVLFTMLPWSHSVVTVYKENSKLEWDEAIRCLGKARQSWLSDLLLISDENFKEENEFLDALKKVQAKAALVRIGSIPLSELAKLKAFILNINSEVIWNILVEVSITLQHNDLSVRSQWLVDSAEILCETCYPSTALRFLGLLSGSSCKYMPILSADRLSVLSDLPTTLSSLLSGTSWEIVAETVASYIWNSTERFYDWARSVERSACSQHIDGSEKEMAVFLLQVMHRTCVSLIEYLPADKQMRLANMVVKDD
ncbi:hypothetical protein OROGR_007621 [Orobanche gracilis]